MDRTGQDQCDSCGETLEGWEVTTCEPCLLRKKESLMPTKGDYHEDEGLKTFILTNYSVEKDTGKVRKNGRKPRDKKKDMKAEYRKMQINGITLPAARVIVLLVTGDWPVGVVGYRNGNPMDLRPGNLIVLSQEDNHRRRYAERGGKMPDKTTESASGAKDHEEGRVTQRELEYKAEDNEGMKQFLLKNYSYIKQTGSVVKGPAPDDPFADVSDRMVGKQRRGSKLRFKVIRIKGFRFLLARVAFLLVNGDWPKGIIAHKNGNRMDTRWSNLIEVGGE